MSDREHNSSQYRDERFRAPTEFPEQFQDQTPFNNSAHAQSQLLRWQGRSSFGSIYQPPIEQEPDKHNSSGAQVSPFAIGTSRGQHTQPYSRNGYAQNLHSSMHTGGFNVATMAQNEFSDNFQWLGDQTGMDVTPMDGRSAQRMSEIVGIQDQRSDETALNWWRAEIEKAKRMPPDEACAFLKQESNQHPHEMTRRRMHPQPQTQRAQNDGIHTVNHARPHRQSQIARPPTQTRTASGSRATRTLNPVQSTSSGNPDRYLLTTPVSQQDWNQAGVYRAVTPFSQHYTDLAASPPLHPRIRHSQQIGDLSNLNSQPVYSPRAMMNGKLSVRDKLWQHKTFPHSSPIGGMGEDFVMTPQRNHGGVSSDFLETMGDTWSVQDDASFANKVNDQSAKIDQLVGDFGIDDWENGYDYQMQIPQYTNISLSKGGDSTTNMQNLGVYTGSTYQVAGTPIRQISKTQADLTDPLQSMAHQRTTQMQPRTQRGPQKHSQPQQARLDASFQQRKRALPPTVASVPSTGKKRKLDNDSAESGPCVQRSKRFDNLQLEDFRDKFLFPHEIGLLTQVRPAQANNVLAGSAVATNLETNRLAQRTHNQAVPQSQKRRRGRMPNTKDKKAPRSQSTITHSNSTTPGAAQASVSDSNESVEQYDNAIANAVLEDLIASEHSTSPIATPDYAQQAPSTHVMGTSSNAQQAIVAATLSAAHQPTPTEERPAALVNDILRPPPIPDSYHTQALHETLSEYDVYSTTVDERSSRPQRRAFMEAWMLQSLNENPTNMPSINHRPSNLNGLASFPNRNHRSSTITAGKTELALTITQLEPVVEVQSLSDAANQSLSNRNRVIEITESSNDTENSDSSAVLPSLPGPIQIPERQPMELDQFEHEVTTMHEGSTLIPEPVEDPIQPTVNPNQRSAADDLMNNDLMISNEFDDLLDLLEPELVLDIEVADDNHVSNNIAPAQVSPTLDDGDEELFNLLMAA